MTYRVGYKLPPDEQHPNGSAKFDEITAGSWDCDGGILRFYRLPGMMDLIFAYRNWDFAFRVESKE